MNGSSPTSSGPVHAADRPELARLLLFGVNAWLVVVLVPALHVGVRSLWDVAASSVPLAVLAGGLALLRPRSGVARWALLAVFPASLAAFVAWRSDFVARDAYGPIGLVLASSSLLAFVASAAHAVGRDRAIKPSSSQPLVGKEPVVGPAARRFLRRALLAAGGAGALALTLIAPTLAGPSDRSDRWGEGADDAAVMATVIGATVACIALGTILGPALRAARTSQDHPAQSKKRLAAAMLIAAGAGVGWLVLAHFD